MEAGNNEKGLHLPSDDWGMGDETEGISRNCVVKQKVDIYVKKTLDLEVFTMTSTLIYYFTLQPISIVRGFS